MSFAHLSPIRISGICQAFDDGGILYDSATRRLLMELVETGYVKTLAIFNEPGTQLSSDLDELNGQPKYKEQVPLKLWLEKGLNELFSGTPQAPYFEDAIQDVEKGPYIAGEPDAIVDGLEALSNLIRTNQNAFKTVIYYQETFKNALNEMEVIAQYKALHENLHQVQLNWPHSSTVEGMLVRQEVDQLFDKADFLKGSGVSLQRTYDLGVVDRDENSWIKELREDAEQVEKALFASDVDQIKQAFAAVAGVLMRELSRLNNRLKEAISSLRLKILIKALNDVCLSVTTLSPNRATAQIEQYKAGIIEFGNMDESLGQLIEQHDSWQRIHDTLHTLRDALKKRLSDDEAKTNQGQQRTLGVLFAIRSTIETMVTPLLEGKTTTAARRLQAAAQNLNAAIDRSEVAQADRAFDTYTQLAWHRFFELDDEMKNACERLKLIGANLRKVNDQLKFTDEWH